MADGDFRGVRLEAPMLQDWVYLAHHMRDDERAQWEALTGMPYDADFAARGFANTPGVAFVLIGADNKPIVGGGFEEIRPKVWQTWMAGSPEGWGTNWRAITKYSRRLINDLFASGRAQRVQTYALESRKAAHQWYLRGLGQSYESTLPKFYSDGQSAVCYARVE